MNGWDLVTYLTCGLLIGSAILIFGFFLRDAKGIILGQRPEEDEDWD